MKWLMPSTTLLQILTILSLGSCADLVSPKSAWPPGTVANGSSTHPPIEPQRNFYSSYAIDGDTDSFWNDDTENGLPDILIIEVPSPVVLDGIILLSSTIKWVLGYTVETLSGSDWILQARVTNCESPLRYVPFNSSVQTTQLRIEVTDEQDGYARINEVYPVFAASTSINTSELPNPTNSETRPSSSTAEASAIPNSASSSPPLPNPSNSNSPKSSNTAEASAVPNSTSSSSLPSPSNSKSLKSSNTVVAIVGGVLGAVVGILCIALAVLLVCFLRRKRRKTTPINNTYTYSPQRSSQRDQSGPEMSIPPAELSNHRYGGIILHGGGSQAAYHKPELESR